MTELFYFTAIVAAGMGTVLIGVCMVYALGGKEVRKQIRSEW